MSSATPLSRKNSVYSRRSPVRARWENDQWRFAKYDNVVAIPVEMTFDVVGPRPSQKWLALNRPVSTTTFTAPTTPNADSSFARTCHGVPMWASIFTKLLYLPAVPAPGHRSAVSPRTAAHQPVPAHRDGGPRYRTSTLAT